MTIEFHDFAEAILWGRQPEGVCRYATRYAKNPLQTGFQSFIVGTYESYILSRKLRLKRADLDFENR